MNPIQEILKLLVDNPNGLSIGTDAQGNPIQIPAETLDSLKQFLGNDSQKSNNLSLAGDISAFTVNPNRGVFQLGGLGQQLQSVMPLSLLADQSPMSGNVGMQLPSEGLIPTNISQLKPVNMKKGGSINKTGYTPGTSTFNNAFNIIPSGNIDMTNTPMALLGISDAGEMKILEPHSGHTKFKGNNVLEVPIKKGKMKKKKANKKQLGGQPQIDPQMLQQALLQVSQAQQDNAFLTQFNDIFPNQQVTQPQQAQFGGLFKNIGRFLGNAGKGIADFTLTNAFGADDVIQNSFVDNNKFLNGVNNVVGGLSRLASNLIAPGAGAALSGVGGILNNQANQSRQLAPVQQQANTGGINPGILGGLGGAGGGLNPFILSLLAQGLSGGNGGIFQLGGFVENGQQLLPIQTEKVGKLPEKIVHLDGTITDVNATKPHSKQNSEDVTDLVVEGSYIMSADKNMKIKKEDAENIVIGVQSRPYKESRKGMLPKEWTLADLFDDKGKGSKELRPAELAERIKDKFPTMEYRREDCAEDDVFTKITNLENLTSRKPYLEGLIDLSEEERQKKTGESANKVVSFKNGGKVEKKQDGGLISGAITGAVEGGLDIAKFLATLGIGAAQTRRFAQASQQNQQDRQAAIAQGRDVLLPELLGNLNQNNAANLSTSILTTLAQNPNVQSTDFSAAESRLRGNQRMFGRTPNSVVNAAARPQFNAGELANRLGRGASTAIASQSSSALNAINNAAAQRFNNDRQFNLGIDTQLAQLASQGAQSRTNALNQTNANRNTQVGRVGQGISDFLSQDNENNRFNFDFTNTSNLREAELSGAGEIASAQAWMNYLGLLNGAGANFSNNPLFQNNGGTQNLTTRQLNQLNSNQYTSPDLLGTLNAGINPTPPTINVAGFGLPSLLTP